MRETNLISSLTKDRDSGGKVRNIVPDCRSKSRGEQPWLCDTSGLRWSREVSWREGLGGERWGSHMVFKAGAKGLIWENHRGQQRIRGRHNRGNAWMRAWGKRRGVRQMRRRKAAEHMDSTSTD